MSEFVQSKRPRTMEVKDLDEVERRAAKLRKVTAGLVASTQEAQQQAHDDEGIDIDDDDEDDKRLTLMRRRRRERMMLLTIMMRIQSQPRMIQMILYWGWYHDESSSCSSIRGT
mmetsp:Transcript_1647/g.2356  ORF Transcript_1647/g.2356 Transcript_1647/m.2356 type:complete len:114 (+) Transcript_1647:1043-1384(+)